MLLRIALVVAILAGVAVTALNLVSVKGKVTTIMTDRNTFKSERDTARTQLATTQRQLAQTNAALVATTRELTTAKTERDTAVAEANTQKQEATRLKEQLDKTTTEKTEAQRQLAAWNAVGYSVDQIKGLITAYDQARKDLDVLTNQVNDLSHSLSETRSRLARYETPNYQVPEPNVLAKVIQVDPKFNFVVLNVGQEQGMLPDGDMLVSRDGRLVATVRIQTVARQRSIANIIRVGQLAEVFEGDMAVPLVPKP